MQPLLNTDFPQDLQDKLQMELASLPNYDLMLSILNKIHLATDKMMADIPLYLLVPLLILAQSKKMDKAIAVIEKEIELNLEAKQELQTNKRLADEAERRAERAEQKLKEVKEFQQSVYARLGLMIEN